MLRYSPSRIQLTLADLDGFEERFQARQSARHSRPKASIVRLSPGPAHPTRLSFVSADQNVGRRRAASSSSDVVQFDDDKDKPANAGPSQLDGSNLTTPTSLRRDTMDRVDLHQQAAKAPEGVFDQHCSSTRPSSRRQVDSFYADQQEIEQIEREMAEHSPASNLAQNLDGVDGSELGSLPPTTPFVSRDNHGRRPPQTEPRPFSSARARRRHARSSEEPGIHHEGIRPFSTQSQMWLNPVPQLVLPTRQSQTSLNPSLDPNAPVFMPRTRFGTAAGSFTDANPAYERPWRSLDHTSSSSNLRVRSSGELNTEPTFPVRNATSRPAANNEQLHPRQRQRSRTSDQNTAFPLPSPNLERYPLLRPSTSLAAPRRTSALDRSSTTAFDRPPSTAAFITTDDEVPASESHQPQNYHVRHALTPQEYGQHLDARPNLPLSLISISPALSTSSRSTPNLLNTVLHPAETHSRGSSLSWRRSRHLTPFGPMHRVPSLPVSATESLSSSPRPLPSRHSSRECLDAAAEFLRVRNSPLDDLTERLSRLAAGRQRSVGRSWERICPESRGRVSLLTGDPFRQESEQDPPTSVPSPATTVELLPALKSVERPASRFVDAPDEDPVALSMALPPSSPLTSSSQALPSTPPTRADPAVSSPRSPLAQLSPAKKLVSSPPPSIKRRPLPSSSTTHATLKVKVYDDKQPATAQPQTPADLTKSSRRSTTQPDITAQKSSLISEGGGAAIASPSRCRRAQPQGASVPSIPERNPYRNTYPPAPSADAARATQDRVEGSRRHARARAQTQRSSENAAENEMEGALQGVEQDRRVWLGRREEGGGLDVTPPREGRFERYLS